MQTDNKSAKVGFEDCSAQTNYLKTKQKTSKGVNFKARKYLNYEANLLM